MNIREIAARVDNFWKRWHPSQKRPEKKTFFRDLYRSEPDIARLEADDLQRVLDHVQTSEIRDLLRENRDLTVREVTEWYDKWREGSNVDFARFVFNRYKQNVSERVLCKLNQEILVAYLEQEDVWPEWALQHIVTQYLRSYAKVRESNVSFMEYLKSRTPAVSTQLFLQGLRLDDIVTKLNKEDQELWRRIHSRPVTPDQLNPQQICRISALYCQDERLAVQCPFPKFVAAILQEGGGRLDELLSELESGSVDVSTII